MEIQRKIVESKNPPSNREVWWFDTNTEVLKRYTGNTWVQVVDSVDSTEPEYDDSGTVINTTYEEAKALYESGNMIPGVRYQFDYTKNIGLFYDDEDYSTNCPNLNLYIDRYGELKAEYTPPIYFDSMIDNPYPKSFIANFNFDTIKTAIFESIDGVRLRCYDECSINKVHVDNSNHFKEFLENNHYSFQFIDDDMASFNFILPNTVILAIDYITYIIFDRHIYVIDDMDNQIILDQSKIYSIEYAPSITEVKHTDGTYHAVLQCTNVGGWNLQIDADIVKCAVTDYFNLNEFWDEEISSVRGYIYDSNLVELTSASTLVVFCDRSVV